MIELIVNTRYCQSNRRLIFVSMVIYILFRFENSREKGTTLLRQELISYIRMTVAMAGKQLLRKTPKNEMCKEKPCKVTNVPMYVVIIPSGGTVAQLYIEAKQRAV